MEDRNTAKQTVSRRIGKLVTTFENLQKLKAKHPVKYNSGFPRRNYTDLERYANVDDITLKRAPKNTLEGVANQLIANAERAEQERIKTNPPVYSREYAEKADYTILDLYSDYKDIIELTTLLFIVCLQIFGADAWKWIGKVRTWDDYKAERKKWRLCKYKFCLNMFPIDKTNFMLREAKRSDAVYCCDDCKTADRDANERFRKTGSYLPEFYYVPSLSESVGDRVRKYESAAESDVIEQNINANRPVRYVVIKRDKPPKSEVQVYKSLEEAEEAHAKMDRTGWISIK